MDCSSLLIYYMLTLTYELNDLLIIINIKLKIKERSMQSFKASYQTSVKLL